MDTDNLYSSSSSSSTHTLESSPYSSHPMGTIRDDKMKLPKRKDYDNGDDDMEDGESSSRGLFLDPHDPFYGPLIMTAIVEGHEALRKEEAELREEQKLLRPDPVQELVDQLRTLGQEEQERVVYEVAKRPDKALSLMEEEKRAIQVSAYSKYPHMRYQSMLRCLLARDSQKMFENENCLPQTAMNWLQQQAEWAVCLMEAAEEDGDPLTDAAQEHHLRQLARGVPPFGLKPVEDEHYVPTGNLVPDTTFDTLLDIYIPEKETAWLCQRANIDRFRRQKKERDRNRQVRNSTLSICHESIL